MIKFCINMADERKVEFEVSGASAQLLGDLKTGEVVILSRAGGERLDCKPYYIRRSGEDRKIFAIEVPRNAG